MVLVKAVVKVKIHLRIAVVTAHRRMQRVAVVEHMLSAELLCKRYIGIHIAIIVGQRLAVVQTQSSSILVLSIALFRRVRGVKGHQSPVVCDRQFTHGVLSVHVPFRS